MLLSSSITVKRVVTCFILSSNNNANTNKSPPAAGQQPSLLVTSSGDDDTMMGGGVPPPPILTTSSSTTTRDTLRVAVFRRCSTMPTFPSHWAGISGSMEDGEEPYQTALRELQEETNLIPRSTTATTTATAKATTTIQKQIESWEDVVTSTTQMDNDESCDNTLVVCDFVKEGGLYLDVPFQKDRVIRVYPFVVHLGDATKQHLLELRGTEHDDFQFISVPELEQQLEPTVPGLVTAFHRATYGKYLARNVLPETIWKWSEDHVNGAATLAKQVMELLVQHQEQQQQQQQQQQIPGATTNDSNTHPPLDLDTIAMLRPTMVPIINVLHAWGEKGSKTKNARRA